MLVWCLDGVLMLTRTRVNFARRYDTCDARVLSTNCLYVNKRDYVPRECSDSIYRGSSRTCIKLHTVYTL